MIRCTGCTGHDTSSGPGGEHNTVARGAGHSTTCVLARLLRRRAKLAQARKAAISKPKLREQVVAWLAQDWVATARKRVALSFEWFGAFCAAVRVPKGLAPQSGFRQRGHLCAPRVFVIGARAGDYRVFLLAERREQEAGRQWQQHLTGDGRDLSRRDLVGADAPE